MSFSVLFKTVRLGSLFQVILLLLLLVVQSALRSLDLDQRSYIWSCVSLFCEGSKPLMLSSGPRDRISADLGCVTSCSFQKLPFDCNTHPGLRKMSGQAFHLTDRKELSQMLLRPSKGTGPPGEPGSRRPSRVLPSL